MKRFLLFFAALFSIAAISAQGHSWTLQQCIDSAVARNLQVRQRNLQAQAAGVNYSQARSNLLPFVNGNVGHSINQGRSIDPFTNGYVNQQINAANYSLNSDIILFNGMTLKNNIRRYNYEAQAAQQDIQQEKETVTLNVILSFLQVLNNEDIAAISKAQLAVTTLQVQRLEILNNEGSIAPPLLYDLRGQQKGEEANLVNAFNNIETAKLDLLQLMNLPYDAAMTVVRDGSETLLQAYTVTADSVYQNALQKMAIVKAAALRTHSAEAAVKAAKGQYYPAIALNGNVGSNYSSFARKDNLIGASEVATESYVFVNGSKTPVLVMQNNYQSQKILYPDQIRNNISTSIGLGIRVPILNGMQTRNQVKLARITVKSFLLAEENTKLLLQQAIERAYLSMTNARERYKALLEQVAAYTESFRAAEVRFNAGAGTSEDYILAKSRLDNANLNLVLAKYDYILRTKVLDYYNGMQ